MNNTITTVLASTLEKEWLTLGYVAGAPSHIGAALVQADVRIYRNQRCGECGGRGHQVTAFHRGGAYRLLCECKKCGSGMEG